jgi:hypothetical protein
MLQEAVLIVAADTLNQHIPSWARHASYAAVWQAMRQHQVQPV